MLKKLSQNIDAFEPNASMHLKLKSNGANVIKKIDNKYDLIVLTDVIEHVKNDRELLSSITDRLNSKGFIFITVPAYQFLYSSKDVQLKHYRRYDRNSLISIIPNDLEIIKTSYLNFFLFIPLASIIMIFKLLNKSFSNLSEETPNKVVNFFLYKIFSIEKHLINKLNFPFGISILAILKKKN